MRRICIKGFVLVALLYMQVFNGIIISWFGSGNPWFIAVFSFWSFLASGVLLFDGLIAHAALHKKQLLVWGIARFLILLAITVMALGVMLKSDFRFALWAWSGIPLLWLLVGSSFFSGISIFGKQVTRADLESAPVQRCFSPCHAIGVFGAFAIFMLAVLCVDGAWMFVNASAMFICFGVTFFMLLASFGADYLRFIGDSFLTLFSRPLEPNPRFAEICVFGARYAVGAGVAGMLICIIQMLRGMDDPSNIGVGMATSMLVPLYSIILSEIIFAFLYAVYSDGKSESVPRKSLPLSYAFMPFVLIVFMVLTFLAMILSFVDLGLD